MIAASASALIVPAFAGPLVAKLPGGAFGAVAVGGLMIWGGTKLDGYAKAVVVGAGVGLMAPALLSFIPGLNGG